MAGKLGYLAAASTALAILPQAAEAQSIRLEEIVVTARRMEENLQRTPVAVTAVVSEMLDNMSITNISQLDHIAPNLQYSPGYSGSSSAANFFIRGIGQGDFVATADPGVSLYLDGVYISRTVGAALDAADVERVEILKGPQGTLFGKNTIGGAISVVTKRPGKEPGGYVEGTLGNYNRMDGRFAANVPISDTLFGKISGVTRNNDGFARRVLDGVRLGDDNDVGGRVQLLWAPNDAFDILLTADGTRRRAHIAAHSNTTLVPSPTGDYFTLLTGLDVMDFPGSSDPRKINTTSVRPTDRLDVSGFSAEINYDFGWASLKSITAYRKLKNETAADFDGTLALYNDQEVHLKQDQFTQEFQLSGRTDNLKWIIGAYYLKEDVDQIIDNYYFAYYEELPYGTARRTTLALETENVALFGQASYNVTDRLSLTAGLRWTDEKKEASITAPFQIPGEASWDNVSPRFGIEFQATDDMLLYASATRGFKSGSFNGRPDTAGQFNAYDPEKVWSYELGLKSQWFDNRLRLNIAGFVTRYTGIQILTGAFDNEGNFYFPVDNAGNAELKGFELEFQARPMEMLRLYGSLGYTDEKWTYISPIAFVTPETRLPSLSHWNANIGAEVDLPLAGFGSLIVGGDYSYRSGYYQTTINSPLEYEDGYSLVNAYVIIEPESQKWQLKFWGKNLTDAEYVAWAQDLVIIGDSHATTWFGRPREYGVTLRVNF